MPWLFIVFNSLHYDYKIEDSAQLSYNNSIKIKFSLLDHKITISS